MSVELESATRLAALKSGIEAKTGETYTDLTGGVNALIAGYGQGGGDDEEAKKGLFYLTDYVDGHPTTLIYNCPGTATEKGLFATNSNYSGYILQYIKKVVMPDTVTTISNDTFSAASSLEEVSNWESITVVHDSAFSINSGGYIGTGKGLQYTEFPPNLTYIGRRAFRKNLLSIAGQIPDTVTHIDADAFAYGGNSNWEITKLPSNLTYIGSNAFMCYRKLLITEIPATVDYVGSSAFHGVYDKTSLTLIKFLGTPTTVGTDAFINNTALADIYVPWAEGAVANAPWGATNATIHYNTTYDENHNPIV